MSIQIDLHCHTNCSDGRFSPKDVVTMAHEKGINVLAITDHDITAGVEEAKETGKEFNITIIPGIELTTSYNGTSVHVLGYFTDDSYKDEKFQSKLSELKLFRDERAKKMIENLKTYFNIEISYDDVFKQSKGVIARPHIAKAIINAGYDYTIDYIFSNIISKKSKAYVAPLELNTKDAIDMLHSLNAVVSFAHPVLLRNLKPEEVAILPFDAIEAIYCRNTLEDSLSLCNLAKQLGKLITCGSDFHDTSSDDTKHGQLGFVGPIALDDTYKKKFLEKLKLKLD